VLEDRQGDCHEDCDSGVAMKLESQIVAMLWHKSHEIIMIKKPPRPQMDWYEKNWLSYLMDIGIFPYDEHSPNLDDLVIVNDPCGTGRLALSKETAMKIMVLGLP
jgi:hypothetical protein